MIHLEVSRSKKDIAFGHGLPSREKVTRVKDEAGIEGVTGLINHASFKGLRRELQALRTALNAMTKRKVQ